MPQTPQNSAAIPPNQLRDLQDGISASIQTILKAYDQCEDPVGSATLLQQSQQLAAQMSAIETALFHQETVQATTAMADAFTSARGFTAQLKQTEAGLDKVSDIINAAAKLIGVVAQIVPYL
jgi:hypothetical protein